MPNYRVSGRIYRDIEADCPAQAVKTFREEFDAFPDCVESDGDGGTYVVGFCEACERLILEGDEYAYAPEDGLHFCPRCYSELGEEPSNA